MQIYNIILNSPRNFIKNHQGPISGNKKEKGTFIIKTQKHLPFSQSIMHWYTGSSAEREILVDSGDQKRLPWESIVLGFAPIL